MRVVRGVMNLIRWLGRSGSGRRAMLTAKLSWSVELLISSIEII